MHCYICDTLIPIDQVRMDPDTHKVLPCEACRAVIDEVISEDRVLDDDSC